LVVLSVLSASGPAQLRPHRRLPPARPPAQRGERRSIPEVLRKVVAAAPNIRFFGERIVDQRVQGQMVRHKEIVLRSGQRTRISFPPDSKFGGQIIVDNGVNRWHYNPRNQRVTQMPSERDDTLNRLVGPNNNLLAPRVSLSDGGAIAGIPTTLARIQNNQGVTIQALYIDPNTGAVLKRVGYDKNGEEVANYEFTSVRYNPSVSAADFDPPRSSFPIITPEDNLRRLATREGFPPLQIPSGQGFRLISANTNMRGQVKVLHEVYQGPSGRVSIFLLRAQVDPSKFERPGRLMNAVTTQSNGVTVVLVGPYTAEMLRRLATNLSP
ncbi:MAG TPA: hypothetical protein VKT78_12035, partial [Fimbriimonadaceae bacterium]|nr:hypothetical protein [Fimbriimonadaceae bacterium]